MARSLSSSFICRDETLTLVLIAGIQNCDEIATTFYLEQLCAEAALAAGVFALTLKAMRMVMMQVPASFFEAIAGRRPTDHAPLQAGQTIH
jgi:hypothetical protein